MGQYAASFNYLAFDDESKKVLAHGETALDTLLDAYEIAPASPIHILEVGSVGSTIWLHKLALHSALAMLASTIAICGGTWLLRRQ